MVVGASMATYEYLPNKWVFKIKRLSDESVDRYNARLVANEFHQQDGLDFTETFSPVVKHTTIHIVIALEIHHHWPIRQLDVHNAFLQVLHRRGLYTAACRVRRP